MNRLAAAALASIALTCDAGAAILYAPTPIGSSARISDYGQADQFGFRSIDNFTLATNAAVERVSWSGLWLDLQNPLPAPAPAPDALSWEIAFHADNGGAPGAQLWFHAFAAADVTANFLGNGTFSANGIFAASFYDYAVDLSAPFALSAGTQYWISVLSRSNSYYPAFALRGATGGDGGSWQQQLGAGLGVAGGNSVAADRAVALEGTIPEPATLPLLASAMLLLPALRRRRGRP